jgi:hypothetical protein
MTHVPWVGLIAKSPAIEGRETLAIEMSRIFINEPKPRARVASIKLIPVNGSSAALDFKKDI